MQVLISPQFCTDQAGRRHHDAIGAVSKTSSLAGEEPKGTDDASVSRFEQRLATFILDGKRRGGMEFGSAEVVQLLRNVAFHDGESFACEMLDLASQACDSDIADYELYREVASTPLSA
ncbi:hypothetical protein [Caballeronia sp. RCC_10]|uniref:hypothetical protein n=1 Tax=Caballeronia sp. RCC_10 TaxID=3239227 RepID=UPI003523D6B2